MKTPINCLQHAAPERFREPAELGRIKATTAKDNRLIPEVCMSPPGWVEDSGTAHLFILARSAMPVGEFH